ncbi:MAG TPA: ATP-dependent helicase C-terminal domain-containing protein [Dongiaceae bacterium]|nr:ATP-dependent helicase C-terminal domain-containing protein [Dongiaceae bacterium]
MSPKSPLPIDAHLDELVAAVRAHRALVVVAPPGAGKTTRLPPALMDDGPVILLQPRRVAARAIARRIASETGATLGEEVGWQVRFERQFTPRTRLLVATEGILTARFQEDPLLSGFRTVVLDEFHERSIHADLGIALARQALRARDDLRVVVMSATLDAARVAEFLGGCPVRTIPGRPHPVSLEYAPGKPIETAVGEALARPGGHVLVFLAGAPEIRRAGERLGGPAAGGGALVLPLHGSLDAEAQEAALAPSDRRKVILATNIAETSLTIDGVTEVIDTGQHKVLRHDPAVGIDRLETERIPRDAADQRAGRAGRTAPGRAVRLWDERDLLRDAREPEIARVDLASTFLDLLAWGGDPLAFEWFEAPPVDRAASAMTLLGLLGAAADGKITPLGCALGRFPLHPRLARLLLDAGGSEIAAAACAVLSENWTPRRDDAPAPTTDSDLLLRADHLAEAPHRVRRAAAELRETARRAIGPGAGGADLLRAAFAAWPDRVARRREPGSPRFVLASGTGATLGRESGVRGPEFVVAIDVVAGTRPAGARGPGAHGAGGEAILRMASRIERDWIVPTRRAVTHRFDAASGAVRAVEQAFFGDLVVQEAPIAPDPEAAAAILAATLLERGLGEEGEGLIHRLRFAGIEADRAALARAACAGRTTLPDPPDLASGLARAARADLDRLAPATLPLPSGRSARLDYRPDGSVVASVKLQELFGLGETPRLGARREPVTFALLAPNGRPVQTTRDLASFWRTAYQEVRRELRGRYPKHPWPEDPWTATPTHRTTRRPKR